MDFFEAVSARYSHKQRFLSDPVPREHLIQIARAGLAAPTGGNSQSVELIILDDRAAFEEVCEVTSTEGLRSAPAGIVVMTNRKTQTSEDNFEKEDYSAAVENMLLAATALGYASLWLDSILFDPEKAARARAVLGAPEEMTMWAILPIGKPDGEGARRAKKPYSERLSYNHYES